MIKKTFKCRLDSRNNVLIKEDLQKNYKDNLVKVSVKLGIVGVEGDYRVAEAHVFKEGVAYKLSTVLESLDSEVESTKLLTRIKDGAFPTYINLSCINYIATLNMTLENNKVIKDNIKLFIPVNYAEPCDLDCLLVDNTLSSETKEDILQKARAYILDKLEN